MKAEVLNSWYINSGDWCSSLRSSRSQGCMLAASSRSSDRLASNAAHVHAKRNTASAANATWWPYASPVMILKWQCGNRNQLLGSNAERQTCMHFLKAQALTRQVLHNSKVKVRSQYSSYLLNNCRSHVCFVSDHTSDSAHGDGGFLGARTCDVWHERAEHHQGSLQTSSNETVGSVHV